MDDSSLATTITDLLERGPFPANRAARLLDALAVRHGMDSRSIFWWAGAPMAKRKIQYDGSEEGFSCLSTLLADVRGEICLVASDECPSPWPVWALRPSEVIPLVSALPFFEYFLVLDDGATLVFDTHHNVLVVSSA